MLSKAGTEDMLHKIGDGQESPAQTAEGREVMFGMNVRLLHRTYVHGTVLIMTNEGVAKEVVRGGGPSHVLPVQNNTGGLSILRWPSSRWPNNRIPSHDSMHMECKDLRWLNNHALVKITLIWKDMMHWEECLRGEDNV